MNSSSHIERSSAPANLLAQIEAQPHLVDKVRIVRAHVGDDLNDRELTRFLRRLSLPPEAGFELISFAEGMVTFSVPAQDLSRWYPAVGWITPEKEKIGRALAEANGLTLCEPVDRVKSFWQDPGAVPASPHHLELSDRWQTVVVAHPRYLKLCVFGRLARQRYPWEARCPLDLRPDILEHLAALYQ